MLKSSRPSSTALRNRSLSSRANRAGHRFKDPLPRVLRHGVTSPTSANERILERKGAASAAPYEPLILLSSRGALAPRDLLFLAFFPSLFNRRHISARA